MADVMMYAVIRHSRTHYPDLVAITRFSARCQAPWFRYNTNERHKPPSIIGMGQGSLSGRCHIVLSGRLLRPARAPNRVLLYMYIYIYILDVLV